MSSIDEEKLDWFNVFIIIFVLLCAIYFSCKYTDDKVRNIDIYPLTVVDKGEKDGRMLYVACDTQQFECYYLITSENIPVGTTIYGVEKIK